ncbi:MAG: DUF2793 domain-containing protein [Erythrobacter sp.]
MARRRSFIQQPSRRPCADRSTAMRPGQAQKEFFVNQALGMIDALLPRSVTAARADPPADVADGACYRVLPNATGDWSDKDETLAVRIGGAWQFVDPAPGTCVFDRSERKLFFYDISWQAASEPPAASGGDTIDAEARETIAQIVEALRAIGILPAAGTN